MVSKIFADTVLLSQLVHRIAYTSQVIDAWCGSELVHRCSYQVNCHLVPGDISSPGESAFPPGQMLSARIPKSSWSLRPKHIFFFSICPKNEHRSIWFPLLQVFFYWPYLRQLLGLRGNHRQECGVGIVPRWTRLFSPRTPQNVSTVTKS